MKFETDPWKLQCLWYLFFFLIFPAPIPCEEHTVTTSSAGSSFSNGVFTRYYIARYCQSNEYSTVCRTGITDEEARILCLENGRSSEKICTASMNTDHSPYSILSISMFDHCI